MASFLLVTVAYMGMVESSGVEDQILSKNNILKRFTMKLFLISQRALSIGQKWTSVKFSGYLDTWILRYLNACQV